MKLGWKKDDKSIFTAYRAEYEGYSFHIVAANSRCVVLGVGPDTFGPYSSVKIAKQFADEIATEIERDKEKRNG
jgi:hypothetical protein